MKFYNRMNCDHQIGRNGYTNGLMKCRKCGAGFSKAANPIYEIGKYRKPITKFDDMFFNDMDDESHVKRSPEVLKYYRIMKIRKSLFGVSE